MHTKGIEKLNNFNEKFKEYRDAFESYAVEYFSETDEWDETLLKAVRYIFFAGGKRIRPVLMLAVSDALGVPFDRVLPFAFALECIHTYSLIHDDLPAMDNDDYRRGRLTSHKVFGEAHAILAGDALLNVAFSVCADECLKNPTERTARASKITADNAGIKGMIKGQSLDILSERKGITDENVLFDIEKNKTAKMIISAVTVPAVLAGKNEAEFGNFGLKLGVQFQVVDDILDVVSIREKLGKTVGKDEKNGKLTYVTLFGLEKARSRAEDLRSECSAILKNIGNCGFLEEFTDYLSSRLN